MLLAGGIAQLSSCSRRFYSSSPTFYTPYLNLTVLFSKNNNCFIKKRITIAFQMAAIAALCVQYKADFRPNMSYVVKALTPLVRPLISTSSNAPEASGV
jgi:hypothetical protein